MAKKLRARWSDAAFVATQQDVLEATFVNHRPPAGADLRGIIVGLDGGPESLHAASWNDADGEDFDASFGRFSCPFVDARLRRARFDGAEFDTCVFAQGRFESSSFADARFIMPSFDDAVFVECSFENSTFRGKFLGGRGGRRAKFERCNFDGCAFKWIELRACRFRACRFEGALFESCTLAGTKFEDGEPPSSAFVRCDR